MSDYSAFFLMKPEDVKRYAVEVLHFFQPEEETDCVEIGDGNINYVFQVRSRKDGRSVIVKQADKLLRSSGRPLDLYRNKIEAETLMLEARLAPKFIPEVYHYDETMAALSMEDISAYKNLRKELAAEYDKLVTFPLYRAPAFRKAYLDGVMADSYGYAGTEIIRRVVGDSKVMEVTSVTDPAQRLPMERALIDLGIYLIKNRAGGLNGAAVTEEFRKILAEGRGTHGQNG